MTKDLSLIQNTHQSESYDLIGNVQFSKSENCFQKQIKQDLRTLKSKGQVIVEADKTTNLYTVPVEKYNEILHQNITKGYKTSTNGRKADIDKKTNTIARKLKIENKMVQHTSTSAFVTLKDHRTTLPLTRRVD